MKKRIIIIGSVFILIDQLIKLLVRNTIMGVEKVIIPNFFYLSGVKNTGGAFSILSDNSIFLAFFSIIVIVLLGMYIYKKKITSNIEMISYSILIGGIIGNLIDRIIFGGVYDYLGFIFGSYYYPIFNLADMGIVIGIILFIILEVKGDKNGISSK